MKIKAEGYCRRKAPTFSQTVIFVSVLSLFWCMATIAENNYIGTALEKRWNLIENFEERGVDAVPLLEDALDSDSALVRRTAAHLLVRIGEPALESIETALDNEDFEVRIIAMEGLAEFGLLPQYWATILTDQHPSVMRYVRFRLMNTYVDYIMLGELMDTFFQVYREGSAPVRENIVKMIIEVSPPTEQTAAFLQEAAEEEESDEIRKHAFEVVIEPTIERLRQLSAQEDWATIVDEFGEEDFSIWPDTPTRDIGGVESTSEVAEAHYLRGCAYYQLGKGEKANADFKQTLHRHPEGGGGAQRRFWAAVLRTKGANYRNNLEDLEQAAEVYFRVYATGASPSRRLNPVMTAMSILRDIGGHERAIAMHEEINAGSLSASWAIRMINDHALTLSEMGRKDEAIAKYEEALKIDGMSSGRKESIKEAISELQ